MVILWINIGSIVVLTLFNYQIFHRMSNEAYKESFISYNQRVSELAFENIDKQIMQSVLRIGQLNFPLSGEDTPLFHPQNKSIIQSSKESVALAEEMRRLQRAYPYAAGLDIYYEATGTIVTGFDKVHASSDAEKVKRYLPWYEEYVNQGRKSGFVLEPEGVYLIDGSVITYIRRVSELKWKGKDIVLAVHILPSSFGEFIDVKSGDLTIVGNDDQILYTTEPENVSIYEEQDFAHLRKESTPLFMRTNEEPVNSSKGLLFQNAVRSVIMNRKTEGAYGTLAPYLTHDSVCTFFLNVPGQDVMYVSVEELQEKFPAEQGRYHVLFTIIEKDGLVAVLNFERKYEKPDIADFIAKMQKHWGNCCSAYGKVFRNQKDGLKNSYKSTVKIFRYHYIFPERQVLCEEELNLSERKETGSHLKLFEAMSKDMRNENLLDFKMHMEFLVTSFKNGTYGIDYCMSTLRDLVSWMYQMIQQNQLDMWVVFGYDIREYYRQIPDIDTFRSWMDGLCEVILKNIQQRKNDVHSDVRTRHYAVPI